jgi:hypothetical protein
MGLTAECLTILNIAIVIIMPLLLYFCLRQFSNPAFGSFLFSISAFGS